MKHQKSLALLLSAVLAAGCLTACSNNHNDPSKPSGNGQSQTETDITPSKFAYQADYQKMTTPQGENFSYVDQFCLSGETIFFSGNYSGRSEAALDENGEQIRDEYGEPVEMESYQTGIFSMNLQTGEISEVSFEPAAVPEGMMGDSYIRSITAAPDGTLWVTEDVSTYTMNLPEGVEEGSDESWQYYVPGDSYSVINQYDADGKKLGEISMDIPQDVYINTYAFDSKGNIYGYDWMNVYVFSPEGRLVKTLPVESGQNMVQISSDKIGILMYEEAGMTLKIINTETQDWGETETLSSRITNNVYPGFGDYDFLYDIGDYIYGHIPGKDQGEKLFSWIDCDVDSGNLGPGQVAFLDDGRIILVEHSAADETELVTLNPVDPASVPAEEKLVLGCLYLDYELKSQVVRFNRAHDDVRITIRDYQEFAEDGNYDDAVRKMNTEILSGKGPDMISIQGMPLDRYAAKGLLIDFWPLIDADPELGRENLMEHFFDAMSIDGKLYGITNGFAINTASCSKKLAGDRTSWTFDEMMEALSKLQPGATVFEETATKTEMLTQCMSFNMDAYIDWNEKTCSFNTPEFIRLLEFAATFSDEIDWETFDWENQEGEFSRLNQGKQLMSRAFIGDFNEVQVRNAYHGGEAAFVGYPSENGSGSSFQPNALLAISSGCSNPQLAWKFVRELLLEENQLNAVTWGLPTNKTVFDAKAEKAMTPIYGINPETGEEEEVSQGGIGIDSDFQIDIYAMTQEEYDSMMSAYNNCNHVAYQDQEITTLVQEEAKAYFNGQKSAEETAKLIQDRVGLYIMEQG